MEWIRCINQMLRYVEAHLQDDLDIAVIARQVSFSPFYLQRMFTMMTDMTVSEYVRQRRLSAAGQELQATNAKVLDVALRYGYETPESFQKAFRRFHGITPSAAKRTRAQLRYLNPLQIQVTLTGGKIMDYSIENLGEITVVGMERRFAYDSAFGQIPEYWDEYCKRGLHGVVPGCLGVCLDEAGKTDFSYLIGNFYEPGTPVPDGFVLRTIAPHTWVKFKGVGALPDSLQRLNRQIFTEWLPNNPEYDLAEGVNIEWYSMGDMDADDYVSEIWIPVVRKKA